jgi:hypothetical protein
MISICIPFHLRGETFNRAYAATFKHYASLPYIVHLCGSEGELSRAFADQFLNETTFYREVPQGAATTSSAGDDILRHKFNDSLATLPKSDWYCLNGADDIVPESFFQWLEDQDSDKVAMAGQSMGSPMIMVDMNRYPRPRAMVKVHLRYRVQLSLTGGVNAFTQKAMNISDRRPYQLHGCETGAEVYFRERGEIIHTPGCVVMPKESNALNQMNKIALVHPRSDVNEFDIQIVKRYLG